jgi:hypothetical protein
MNGTGKMDLSNDDFYEGEFLNGKFHGNGKYSRISDLSIYIGEFKNGEKNGKGRLYFDNEDYELVGNWKNDIFIS